MRLIRRADAIWRGDLMSGQGSLKLESQAFEGPYSFKGRTTNELKETNPEELLGAAHAGCYTMQLSALLTKANHPPEQIHTIAKVTLDSIENGYAISQIDLDTSAKVPNITQEEFHQLAEKAKVICPLSKALASVQINLKATLL